MLGALGLMAMAAAALLVFSPVAFASGSKCNPGCEAQVEFRSYGEHLIVHDYKKDGHSAVGLLQRKIDGIWWNVNTSSGTNGHFWNSTGFYHPPVHWNLSMDENRRVRYRACKGEANWTHPNGGTTFDCSRKWRYDRA